MTSPDYMQMKIDYIFTWKDNSDMMNTMSQLLGILMSVNDYFIFIMRLGCVVGGVVGQLRHRENYHVNVTKNLQLS